MNYINSHIINKNIKTETINGITLDIVHIDGSLYRGDHNNKNLIGERTQYFSDKKSANEYANDDITKDGYIKVYATKHKINILSLNNTSKNISQLKYFFTKYLVDRGYTDGKKLFVLLQIFYGLIDGPFSKLDMMGYSIKDIKEFLVDDKLGMTYNALWYIDKIFQLTNDKTVLPSRCSFNENDKLIARKLKEIFMPLGIHGIWFSHQKINENLLCFKVNQVIFKYDEKKFHYDITCVPNEMGIFCPKCYLTLKHIIKIKQEDPLKAFERWIHDR